MLEQDPRTLKERELPYYAPADQAGVYVPEADLMVITGVTILNDTLPGLLDMAKPGAQILVTGPTASMLPDAFFSRGVTMLGGIHVTKRMNCWISSAKAARDIIFLENMRTGP